MCDDRTCDATWIKHSIRGEFLCADCPCGFSAEVSVIQEGCHLKLADAVNAHLGFIPAVVRPPCAPMMEAAYG